MPVETTARRVLLAVPNGLTISRFLGSALAWRLLGTGRRRTAALVIAAAALTDLLDGVVARRLNATSAVGARLDTVADRALFFVSLTALRRCNAVSSPLIALVAAREGALLIGAAATAGQVEPPGVRPAGRAATALFLIGASAGLAGEAWNQPRLGHVGTVAIAATLPFSYFSLAQYATYALKAARVD